MKIGYLALRLSFRSKNCYPPLTIFAGFCMLKIFMRFTNGVLEEKKI
jgi:hypothetical protein